MAELLQEPMQAQTLRTGIAVDNLVKTYKGGRVKVLNGLSLKIKPGEALGLIGPNGAGKTTFLGCLMGFLQPDSGSIFIDGEPPDALFTRQVVGYLPERLTFDRWMSGRDYMHYHHELAGMPAADRITDCEQLLQRVELKSESWNMPVKKYSRGMLQRLGFAQALVGKPRYLLLDEPASGMDPAGVAVVRQLLKSLKDEGLTILLNSHQLDQIEKVCDRVAFIQEGKVGLIEDLREQVEQEQLLMIRWHRALAGDLSGEDGARVAQEANVIVEEIGPDYLRVRTRGSASTVKLVKALVSADFPVTQVSPEETRLERLFLTETMGNR
jgi:ABC-2 type transport system ATP-binding protein